MSGIGNPSDVDMLVSAEEELDLSGEGFQPFVADFLITEAEIEETDKGQRAVVKFEAEHTDGYTLSVTERFWLKHENAKAEAIGRGQLKRLFAAVFGGPKGSLSSLPGQYVNAQAREDDAGFRRIGRYKAVANVNTSATPDVTL
jgi:hypothetical protein